MFPIVGKNSERDVVRFAGMNKYACGRTRAYDTVREWEEERQLNRKADGDEKIDDEIYEERKKEREWESRRKRSEATEKNGPLYFPFLRGSKKADKSHRLTHVSSRCKKKASVCVRRKKKRANGALLIIHVLLKRHTVRYATYDSAIPGLVWDRDGITAITRSTRSYQIRRRRKRREKKKKEVVSLVHSLARVARRFDARTSVTAHFRSAIA